MNVKQVDAAIEKGPHQRLPIIIGFKHGAGHVLCTAFHNKAQVSEQESRLLRFLILQPVLARAAAATAQAIQEQHCEPGKEIFATIDRGQASQPFVLDAEAGSGLRYYLNWTGIGTLRLTIRDPAGLPNCFLWMCRPEAPIPSDLRLCEDLAGCFEAVADVLGVLRQLQYEPGSNQVEFEQALDLLAEAQSALRAAIMKLDGPSDTDQVQVYNWLKTTANENQIFIQRYMRSDDPADSSQWTDLSARIEALDSRLQDERQRLKERKRLLGKVRHKVSLLNKVVENANDHWRIIAATVDELVKGGLPSSNRELRELLVPVIDDIPEFAEAPAGFEMVLREIDRFLATCPPPDTAPVPQQSAQVQSVAQILAGKSVVLIGGDCRPAAYKALKGAFRLSELHWVETKDHEPTDYFEPYIARTDVAVVLLAIRWSSHSYTDINTFCTRYGKPLVRLPGGYNPNQVAAQIMDQCSDRLGR